MEGADILKLRKKIKRSTFGSFANGKPVVMKFGKVPENELNNIDFTLPPEPAGNKLVLPGKPVARPAFYVGCANRGTKEWIGKIYPKGTKEAGYLDQYVHHFNSIEFNATHYQVYGPDVIGKWAEKAKGKDFKFCPKVPQLISHYSNFNNTDQLTTAFLEGILAFGEHLGPIFLQVSENFSPANRKGLYNYLRSLPTDLGFFLEVRHPAWLEEGPIKKELFETLRALKIGAVITDTAGRRDCAHMELTIPKIFIRYVGNSLHPTDHTRLEWWVQRMQYWLEQGLEEVYFFMHTHEEIHAPEMIDELADKMNAAYGLQIPKPIFIQPEQPKGGLQMSIFD